MARTLPKKHIFKTTVGTGGVPSDSQTTIPLSSVPANISDADYLPNEITITDGTNYETTTFTGYTAPNLTGCIRGIDGTSAREWEADATVYFAPVPKNVDDVESALDALGTRIDGVSATGYGDLYVTDAGVLDVDIASGKFYNIGTGVLVSYAGTTGETLTDDATNYIELTNAGVLSINTSAFTAGNTPLAEVICTSGDITTLNDKRGLVTGGLYTPNTKDWTELTVTTGEATLDLSTATNQYSTFIANTVVTLTGGTEGDVKRYRVTQDSTGSRTIIFKVVDNDFVDGDVNTTDDEITVDNDIPTGTRLIFTGADLPDPLVAATEYWAINVDSTTIQVATTRANAKAGTAITLTDVGSGSRNVYSKPLSPDGDDIVLTTDAYAVDEIIAEYNGENYIVSSGNFNIS